MSLRRLRELFVTALLCGAFTSLFDMVLATALYTLWAPRRWPDHDLLLELVITSRLAFGYGAAVGLLFAALLIVAERHRTIGTMARSRFRLWGAVAGAGLAVVVARLMHVQASGLKWEALTVFNGGFVGMQSAAIVLWIVGATAATSEATVSRSGHR